MGDGTARERIERALDEKVRPALRADGGGVEVVSFEEGALTVKFLGKCAGCPSAAFEIEELVAAGLRDDVPEVRSVAAASGVSGELLEAARSLLARNRRDHV
jgi:Fe-S cluster biogenesis protein NfuA